MALAAGVRLGPYEVLSAIGAGGMGEVYKARDTRLDRTVAIKVLPTHVASDPEVRQRFEREARAVAALNHPHICTLHDIGSQDGLDFLVMEYLDGETLAERLTKAQGSGLKAQGSGLKAQGLPLDQALRYAIEIADALDKAHRAGIVHRDLKPGNIMLTKGGAKLLDFGLAKSSAPAVATGLSVLPTTPPNLTAQGTILGTFQYMAPEQLEGGEADARTDIFAFGAVLYEMLTGQKAFEGKSQASLIAAILEREPRSLALLQPTTPPALDRLVTKLLAKEPDARWQSARDVHDELQWIRQTPAFVANDSGRSNARNRLVLTTVALAVGSAAALAAWMLKPTPAAPNAVTRFEVVLPADAGFTNVGRHVVALSPDGSRLVFVANNQLYLRTMDQLEATPIRGTNVAPVGPFFSSDGQSIAFFSNNQLKKISVNGGAPLTVTDTTSPFGGSWSGESILLGAGVDGIYRVPAAGGPRERIISLQAGEQAHGPQLLSDGNTVLFTLRSGTATWDEAQIVAQSLDTGERRVLIESGRDARLLPTGHLIYARLGTLFSVAFDPVRLTVIGSPVSWVDGVADAAGIGTGAVHYTVSANGTLVYVPSGAGNLIGRRLVWVDRQGNEEPIDTPPHLWSHLRISPEGSRVAIEALDEERDIWIWDFSRAVLSRLTFEPVQTRVPVWLNRERVAYMTQASAGAEFGGILARAANGTGAVENLLDGPPARNPSSVSPDGKWLVFSESTPNGIDVAMLSLDADRRVQVLLKTPFDEQNGEVSPDGKWLAYQSNESGANEVYVRPFPDVDRGRWQISSGGGTRPVWSRDGTELFYYVESGKMMAVPIATTSGSAFTLGNAAVLFEGSYLAAGGDRNYDVAIDGRRFLMVKQTGTADESPRIVVVENWFEELKRRVQTN